MSCATARSQGVSASCCSHCVHGVHRAGRHRPDGVIRRFAPKGRPGSAGCRRTRCTSWPADTAAGRPGCTACSASPPVPSEKEGCRGSGPCVRRGAPGAGSPSAWTRACGGRRRWIGRSRAGSCDATRSAAWSRGRSRPPPGSCPGSQMISESSYSRTAPNPLQLEQAPRGLLKEKSAGVTVAAGVSQLLQAGNSVNRVRPVVGCPPCSTMATPSPSWKAVASASVSREAEVGPPSSRSTITSSSSTRVRSSRAGSSSRCSGTPSATTRMKPSARRFSTTVAWVSRATGGSGKQTWSRPLTCGENGLGRLLRRVPAHRPAADPAVALADAGPEQPQVVVHLGGGADGGAAGHDGIPLLDGHGGCQPLEPVHQRLRHAVEKLLGVGRQRLDVAPLPLGVEGVEGQGALAGARGSGDHDERAMRQVDADALQVVLPGVDDADDGWTWSENSRPSACPVLPLFFPFDASAPDPQAAAPRLRDFRRRLAGGLGDHAPLRQRPSRLPRRPRPGQVDLGPGRAGARLPGLDRRGLTALGGRPAHLSPTHRSKG